MRYIKTKDGIYEATEINGMIVARGGVAYSCDIADVHFPMVFKEKDILKQADTIEELCDEFVAVGIPFRTFIVDLDELKKSGLDIHSFSRACYMQYKNCAIYGAIYTNNGLIYVAKMNKDGELCLI